MASPEASVYKTTSPLGWRRLPVAQLRFLGRCRPLASPSCFASGFLLCWSLGFFLSLSPSQLLGLSFAHHWSEPRRQCGLRGNSCVLVPFPLDESTDPRRGRCFSATWESHRFSAVIILTVMLELQAACRQSQYYFVRIFCCLPHPWRAGSLARSSGSQTRTCLSITWRVSSTTTCWTHPQCPLQHLRGGA